MEENHDDVYQRINELASHEVEIQKLREELLLLEDQEAAITDEVVSMQQSHLTAYLITSAYHP